MSALISSLWKEKMFLSFASKYISKNNINNNSINIDHNVIHSFFKFIDNSDFEYLIEGESEVSKIKEKLIDNNLSINPFSKNISNYKSYKLIKDLESYINNIKKIDFYDLENKKFIENGLLREFSRLVFGEKERIKVSLFTDKEYLDAVSILNSDKYYEILGY